VFEAMISFSLIQELEALILAFIIFLIPTTKFSAIYNRLPSIQHPQEWTCAALSNIPNYQTKAITTHILKGNLVLLHSQPSLNMHF
jgi:hypothetical protein